MDDSAAHGPGVVAQMPDASRQSDRGHYGDIADGRHAASAVRDAQRIQPTVVRAEPTKQ